jgi:hypothetical protein
MKYKCDSCKNETEEKYDLVLFACGIRLWLCKKCYCKALGIKEIKENERKS